MAMLTVEQIKKLIEDNRLDIFYNSKYWRRFSHEVKREQNNECQICKSRGKYLPAKILHHVKHLKERPDLAYSRYYTDENGVKHKSPFAGLGKSRTPDVCGRTGNSSGASCGVDRNRGSASGVGDNKICL